MTKIHSRTLDLYLGQYYVSSYFKDAEVGGTKEEAEVTNFASTAKEFLIGQTEGDVSLSGFFDAAANAIAAQIDALIGVSTPTPLTMAWQGDDTLHNFAAVLGLVITKVSPKSSVGNAVLLDVEGRPSAGPDWGTLHAQLNTGGVGTTAFTSYDWGATDLTSLGFAANLHVTGITLSPTLAGKIQDSADNAAWADITGGAFTNISVAGSQHLTGTASVRRYTRWAYTISGTGTMSYLVSFAKKR